RTLLHRLIWAAEGRTGGATVAANLFGFCGFCNTIAIEISRRVLWRGAKSMSLKTGLPRLPDHTQLPAEDGAIVHNFEELKQSMLLADCLEPVLEELHPDGLYCIGQDTGIYWRL